jgi:hypothetical protein
VIYLQELKQDYKECLKSFMQSDSGTIKVGISQGKVFDWLRITLENLTGNAREQLKQEALRYLNDMDRIDTGKTAKLVKNYYD